MAEVRRLFIGGLFKDITEDSLKERFGKFGSISDVEIKHKFTSNPTAPPDGITSIQGDWHKSFAFLNIEATPQDFSKCLQILGKTKWKGHSLRVEEAGTDVISALITERQCEAEELIAEPLKSLVLQEAAPTPVQLELRGATPGTVVPGKKNWVVTKFARTVPIVYIRRKDKKKVMKYDPSKFCHQLKKLDSKEAECAVTNQSVASLTWSLPESSCKKKSSLASSARKVPKTPTLKKNRVTHQSADESKESVCSSDKTRGPRLPASSAKQPTSSSESISTDDSASSLSSDDEGVDVARGKRLPIKVALTSVSAEQSVPQACVEKNGGSDVEIVPLALSSGRADSETDSGADTDEILSAQTSRKKATLQRAAAGSRVTLQPASTGTKVVATQLLDASVCATHQTNVGSEVDHVAKQCAQRGDSVLPKCRPQAMAGAQSTKTAMASEVGPNLGASRTAAESVASATDLARTQAIDVKTSVQSEDSSKGRKSIVLSANKVATVASAATPNAPGFDAAFKHELSNKRRMETIKEKQQQAKIQQQKIKAALTNVDVGSGVSKTKHITFESDEDDGKAKNCEIDGDTLPSKKGESTPAACDAKKATLFDSESESEETLSAYSNAFEVKPQFEGKKGEKLMKVQSRFNNDERFRLTEKFAEHDSEEEGADAGNAEADQTAETSEKERNLLILRGIVGDKRVKTSKVVNASTSAKFNNMFMTRYDPTDEQHKHLELAPPEPKEKKPKKSLSDKDGGQMEQDLHPVPSVSRDRFFDVGTSLPDLFAKKEAGQFSFFEESDIADVEHQAPATSTAKSPVSTAAQGHPWMSKASDYFDSSASDEGSDCDLQDPSMPAASAPKSLEGAEIIPMLVDSFFFVKDDPRLLEGRKFCRTEPLETIREKWQQNREELIEDYKLQRKRVLRKLRSKQNVKIGKKPSAGERLRL